MAGMDKLEALTEYIEVREGITWSGANAFAQDVLDFLDRWDGGEATPIWHNPPT